MTKKDTYTEKEVKKLIEGALKQSIPRFFHRIKKLVFIVICFMFFVILCGIING